MVFRAGEEWRVGFGCRRAMCFVVCGRDGKLEEKVKLTMIFCICTGQFSAREMKKESVKNHRPLNLI